MGKRPTDREKLLFKLDLLSDNEVHEILEYISIMESMRCDRSEREILEDFGAVAVAQADIGEFDHSGMSLRISRCRS